MNPHNENVPRWGRELQTTAGTPGSNNHAEPGGLCIDTTNILLYQNQGTHTTPVWVCMGVPNTSQAFLPVPLTAVRESASNDLPNAAAHGGVLATDTTPILKFANGDTDSSLRLWWVASDSDPIVFQMPLPPDLDTTEDVVVHLRASMSGGGADTPVIDADSYFNEGDTKVSDASAAIANGGATFTEYTITVDADDVPVGAQTVTCEMTPAAHTTDALAVSAIWIEYTRSPLTS